MTIWTKASAGGGQRLLGPRRRACSPRLRRPGRRARVCLRTDPRSHLEWSPSSEICGVARTRSILSEGIQPAFHAAGIECELLENDEPGAKSIRLGTMHRVKGLEFRVVFVVSVRDGVVPLASVLDVDDPMLRATAESQQRCLLYAAATRARDRAVPRMNGEASHAPGTQAERVGGGRLHRLRAKAPYRGVRAAASAPRTALRARRLGAFTIGTGFIAIVAANWDTLASSCMMKPRSRSAQTPLRIVVYVYTATLTAAVSSKATTVCSGVLDVACHGPSIGGGVVRRAWQRWTILAQFVQ